MRVWAERPASSDSMCSCSAQWGSHLARLSVARRLLEDSVTDALLVANELGRSWQPVEVERVDTSETMRAALDRQLWDVVLSDWSMPKFSGASALNVLKETGVDLPFVIVSGTIGEENAPTASSSGARRGAIRSLPSSRQS
jgi:DNA-binding NtrC family response regulator